MKENIETATFRLLFCQDAFFRYFSINRMIYKAEQTVNHPFNHHPKSLPLQKEYKTNPARIKTQIMRRACNLDT